MDLLKKNTFYLVGIKGVAMTALAECLVDADKKVRGSDVEEEFVTQPILARIGVSIDTSFETEIPEDTDCVIYTAAHQAQNNPQVQRAQKKDILTISHAEALGSLFNQKQGIAVCGVGGKSTVSAMITWILEKSSTEETPTKTSFLVGVGNIPGIEKTGQWIADSPYFIAEADDYVIDPSAPAKNEDITPRFSFLNPYITVCTNLKFDHPDVYKNFAHTKQIFSNFFNQIKANGWLIINQDDQPLAKLAAKIATTKQIKSLSFGESSEANLVLKTYNSKQGITTATIYDQQTNQTYTISLTIPGKFNIKNAMAALLTCKQLGIPYQQGIKTLTQFKSTQRRFEFIGKKNGVYFYDDYAHHPHEVAAAIKAIQEWYPDNRIVIAFQSHTFSRTKQLFDQFVEVLSQANEVVMIDIFASAREKPDPTVSSDLLCQKIKQGKPSIKIENVHTIQNLAAYLRKLPPKTVVLTLGAGDIYQVHQYI